MDTVCRIVIKEEIQKIIDHFWYCFNIRILFYHPEGEILRVGMNRPDSPFCTLIREKLYGAERCLLLDEEKRQEAAEKHRLICYSCHAGLTESIYPIYAGGHLLAYAVIGQFRSSRTMKPSVSEDWNRMYGTSKLQTEFDSLPCYEAESIDHILGLFRMLVEYVVSKELLSLEGNLLVERISSYLDRHITRSVTISEVARQMKKSTSTVSHLVKEYTGMSFKQFYLSKKIRKAEEFLRLDPGFTVAEVAEILGYKDPFYFSRIFRKYRNMPPSEFIRRNRIT